MDLMQTIMGLLSGNVINKLSSLIGKDPETTKAAVTKAVPALLAGMSHVASTPEGAQKMVSQMGQMGAGSAENLGGMMSGQANNAAAPAADQGGSMLSSL